MPSTTSLGKKGEELAAGVLEAAGMRIIAKNVRSDHGEVDIIALQDQTIVFVEVKTWSAFGLEDLQYSLDLKKQRRIIKTAKYFLSAHREYSKMTIRFDVIFVKGDSVTHLASAFTENVL